MNLAILHYHLNRSGVTRVIENQILALDAVLDPAEPWRVAVLSGGRRQGWREELPTKLRAIALTVDEVPLLDYDERIKDPPADAPSALSRQLSDMLSQRGFRSQETVLHVHNHALGKNVALPECLRRLAGEGYPLLLQIHDFPEDFRTANYRRLHDAFGGNPFDGQKDGNLAAILYPQAPHIHYAVLNGRDQNVLEAAGARQVHRLPNPVPTMNNLPPRSDARDHLAERFAVGAEERYVLYPVRCIRRKNIGEALLYSALAPPGYVIGLTLAPLNAAEVRIYESWKRLAAELQLPCRFEVSASGGLSFTENLAAADLFLTTSLAEGFGMVFLESWLAGRPLVGRNLPEITRDFAEVGIRFDWLGPRLGVPVEWIGIHTFRRTILEAYQRTLQAYGREEPEDLARQLEARTDDGLVDFGDLDETLQQQVIRIVHGNQTHRGRLLRRNPWIEAALRTCASGPDADSVNVESVILENARSIEDHFSRKHIGGRLLALYQRVAASPRAQEAKKPIHGERILDEFLDFRRFRPIRS